MNSSRDKEYSHLQEPYLEEYDEDEEDDWEDNMSPEEKYQSEITQEEKRQKEEIFGTLWGLLIWIIFIFVVILIGNWLKPSEDYEPDNFDLYDDWMPRGRP